MDSLGNDNRISVFESLDDPGQPYSCSQWGDLGQEAIPVIVEPNYQYQLHDWFSVYDYFGVIAILDPNMVFRYCGANTSEVFYTIEQILAETNWVVGDLNFDEIVNIQDIIILVDSILNSSYNYSSDLNQDEIVNIQDIILLIEIILED